MTTCTGSARSSAAADQRRRRHPARRSARPSQTVRNIEWFEAKEIRGQVVDGDVAYFQVTVKFGFRVED